LFETFDSYFLNGCCVPGHRKNYIDVDGNIHVCEKISTDAPAIGHVQHGYDFEKIQKVYIDDYAGKSISDCSRCWGLGLCDVCYITAYNKNGEFDLKRKRRKCTFMLKSLELLLSNFITLMEENPERLDYLYQYELK
jgi:uncharacterized protein